MYWAQKTIRFTVYLAVGLCCGISLAEPGDEQYAVDARSYTECQWLDAGAAFEDYYVAYAQHKRRAGAPDCAGVAVVQVQTCVE